MNTIELQQQVVTTELLKELGTTEILQQMGRKPVNQQLTVEHNKIVQNSGAQMKYINSRKETKFHESKDNKTGQ